jgi:hypothetical protein
MPMKVHSVTHAAVTAKTSVLRASVKMVKQTDVSTLKAAMILSRALSDWTLIRMMMEATGSIEAWRW